MCLRPESPWHMRQLVARAAPAHSVLPDCLCLRLSVLSGSGAARAVTCLMVALALVPRPLPSCTVHSHNSHLLHISRWPPSQPLVYAVAAQAPTAKRRHVSQHSPPPRKLFSTSTHSAHGRRIGCAMPTHELGGEAGIRGRKGTHDPCMPNLHTISHRAHNMAF